MISFLKGTVYRWQEKMPQLELLVSGVGYEITLPMYVFKKLQQENVKIGEPLELNTYYHVTERIPKPQLIGFPTVAERQFFELMIDVEGLGPAKVAQALSITPSEVALAIEREDYHTLTQLPGVGSRAAHKMVASLKGKVTQHAASAGTEPSTTIKRKLTKIAEEALSALVSLGYRQTEARNAVTQVITENPECEDSLQDILKLVFSLQNRN